MSSGTEGQGSPQNRPPTSSKPSLAPSASAGDREYDLAVKRREEEEERQVALNRQVAEAREAHRVEWEETDAAVVAAQHRYAEHIAKLPTPEALDELGSTVGDATRGPAS